MLEKISRFYLSKKTFLIAAVVTMILGPVGVTMSAFSGEMIPFEWISFLIILCSMIGLLIIRRNEDHILMNGIISGILITEIIRYGYLIQYIADSLTYFRGDGFLGCFGISSIILDFAVFFLIAFNHFSLNRRGGINRTKIIVNQFLLFLAFFSPVAFFIIGIAADYTAFELLMNTIVYSADSTLLLVVACCELDLALNRKDGIVLEKAVSKDIKTALWYAVAFLISLLCLSMAALMPDTQPLAYWINSIDLLLSIIMLVYYLNRNRESSPKGKRRLRVSFILSIGLTVLSLGCFIRMILS